MQSRLLLLGLLVFALLLAGCAQQTPVVETPKGPAPEADLAALREMLVGTYARAYNAKDAAAVAALFTEDAVRMSPDAPATSGRAAILAEYTASIAENTKLYSEVNYSATFADSAIAGDWAWANGNFVWTGMPLKGKTPVEIRGKWLAACKRQADGAWKMHRVAWNADHPIPAPPK